MAFGLPTDQRSQAMLLIIMASLAGGYFFWSKVQSPKQTAITQAQTEIDSLSAVIREPGDTGKAKKPGQPAFDIYRYHYEMYGHYDDIGEFLSDVATLARIMVPQSIVLKAASQQTQKLVGDTLGALLEADFDLRTYVKRV